MLTYLVETTIVRKQFVQTQENKSSEFTKKITYADDTMIHNFVKDFGQTPLHL
jgi:hypothetical protein